MVGIMTNVDSTTPSWDFRKEIVKRATDCVAERCVAERERERELTDIVHGVERAAKYR